MQILCVCIFCADYVLEQCDFCYQDKYLKIKLLGKLLQNADTHQQNSTLSTPNALATRQADWIW